MKYDAFLRCHPAVNFAFFAFALLLSMLLLHPLYLAISVLSAAGYYLYLARQSGLKRLVGLFFLFVLLSAINPIFNTGGTHVLFRLFGRPYTLEALCYGMAISGMFVAVMIWFMCYQRVMTGDRFTALFGNLIPSLSLLLVMVFRLIPDYTRRAQRILDARKCIGRGGGALSSRKEKLGDGLLILSAMTGWALESSVVTADSMRSRGFGMSRRTCFQRMRMKRQDILLVGFVLFWGGISVFALVTGAAQAGYTPDFYIAPMSGFRAIVGAIGYAMFLSMPLNLNLWEEISWHISRSKI